MIVVWAGDLIFAKFCWDACNNIQGLGEMVSFFVNVFILGPGPGPGSQRARHSRVLLQDFSPTTRLFSEYKTLLWVQDFSPTTRLSLSTRLFPSTRLLSDYKTFLRLQVQYMTFKSNTRLINSIHDF